MVENRPVFNILSHIILILGVIVIVFPIYVAFIASTQASIDIKDAPMSLLPGGNMWQNYSTALTEGITGGASVNRMLQVSFIVAMGVALGKIILSLLAAFALVYFRFPLRKTIFGLIFITLMIPVEVRISPTYDIVTKFNLINTYSGIILPLIASATATFLFRQFFMTVPHELVEAARVDGAGPMRFFFDILIPLSKTSIAALFVIQFTYGWNQYLWPLLMKTTEEMSTIVVGIKLMIGTTDSTVDWGVVMATAMIALVIPTIVVLVLQKWFVKGLIDTEK
ncbi:MAG: sn-glycerol-3-phosphate ABC transporter permease UgpE [Neisseriaceae bacterium]|nr:MAG: sn-glycerol-3-phosphate ABC transporter permease UgpE [Neisseriaceae bacterium]